MDTGSNAKKDILLGAGLNALHKESKEWLNTIAFWKDEVRFFADLLDKEKVKASEYGQMLQYMDKVHQTLFDYLAEDIVAHESLLSRLIKGKKGLADEDYRERHAILRDQMDLFTKDFMELKKMVFGYAKKL